MVAMDTINSRRQRPNDKNTPASSSPKSSTTDHTLSNRRRRETQGSAVTDGRISKKPRKEQHQKERHRITQPDQRQGLGKEYMTDQVKASKAHALKSQASAPELIKIFVNNRLGSKHEIPCSSTDTIADLKKLVAFQIGSKPEAILLKRQGEKPLRDTLTLEDYEMGNGSSLDLEVDTGE